MTSQNASLSAAVAAQWLTVMTRSFPRVRRLSDGVWIASDRALHIEVRAANEPDVLTAFGATVLGLARS